MKIKERYKYTSDDKVGEGGFASVYKARDTNLDRFVALKFYTRKDVHGDKTLVNEIRTAINLDHPNLGRYYDVQTEFYTDIHGGTEEVQIGIMEYIDGGEIDDYIRKHPKHLVKLAKDVLLGLEFLHNNRIIHRDLKPSNILVKTTPEGPIAKIVDFGISKNLDATKKSSSKLMGTLKYMAPEQFDPKMYGIKQHISTNVDLWSFGLILYELVTQRPLIEHREEWSFSEVVRSIQAEIPYHKINALPEPYKGIISKCVVHQAEQRTQTARELINILEKKGSGSTVIVEDFISKGEYSEGLAWAKFKNGLYGYVNADNNTIIDAKYSLANNFANGTATVNYHGEWIKIDRWGKTIHDIPSVTSTPSKKPFFSNNIAFVIVMGLTLASFLLFLYDNNTSSYYNPEETIEELDSTALGDEYYYEDSEIALDSAAASID